MTTLLQLKDYGHIANGLTLIGNEHVDHDREPEPAWQQLLQV